VLDAIGPYQVLSGLPGAEVAFVAERPGPIRDEAGSLILPARRGGEFYYAAREVREIFFAPDHPG
jgi:hypothetical protein